MRTLTLVVPDPPPLREHPGRGAGIESPHATPLTRAGMAAVAANPAAFPFQFEGMVVRYGRTLWNVDPLGYQPDHPILEVLAAAGAVWDPDAYWSRDWQDRDADNYVVTFTSEDASFDSPGPSPITAWTEVPAEFRQSSRAARAVREKRTRKGPGRGLTKSQAWVGEGYDWVECGACGAAWQVPHYAESVG